MSETIKVTPLDANAEVIKVTELKPSTSMTLEEFIQTDIFKQTVQKIATSTGKPPTEVAGDIVHGLLGTVSDTSIRVVSVVENFINNITDLAANTIKGANRTVCSLAKDTVKTITFGKGEKE